jgi:two-component sensor histidine kinase/CHASE3 domain sensor protein
MRGLSRTLKASLALLAIGFLALLAIVAMTFWLGNRAQLQFESTIQARDTRAAAVELRYALQTAESSQRGYLVSGNQIYLAPLATAKTLASRQLDALETHLKPLPESQPAFARLKQVIGDKFTEIDTTIALKRDRRDAQALNLFRTNRGKALMDEANVFLSSVIRSADERLTNGAAEQRENTTFLLFATIAAGALIVLAVAIGTTIVFSSVRDITKARDEVEQLNSTLEKRVEERTAELSRARDRAEVLVDEVNHRVANSLSIVAAMVSLQSRYSDSQATKDALDETEGRIFAISQLHKRLYTSKDARFVALDEYLAGLLEHLQTSLRDVGHHARLTQDLAPISMPTSKSVNLGVVATEWVTNAFKYAYPDAPGEVRVSLRQSTGGGAVELVVEDDGVGRDPDQAPKGTGLGTRLVNSMAGSMGAEVSYQSRRPGTTARLIIPNPAE